MKRMNVIGLDLSLTSTGYAYRPPTQTGRLPDIVTGRIKPHAKMRGVPRLFWLRDRLFELFDQAENDGQNTVTLAVIEDYAMGKGGKQSPGRTFNIGEWGGVARLTIHSMGIPIVLVSPSSLKMFATTSGGHTIKKEHVIQAIADLWEYDVPQDDEADAFVLMMLGEAYVNPRKRRRYGQNRLRALDKVIYVDVPDQF